MTAIDLKARAEATDHLLKAVVALLAVKDPAFLNQLDQVFALADAHDSPISKMRTDAWTEIRREMMVIRDFVHGEEGQEATASAARIKKAH